MEFKEFEPRFKSAKTQFKLSAGLNFGNICYKFKWNQPYLSRGLNLNHRSNSLNSATDFIHLRNINYADAGFNLKNLGITTF